MNNIIEFVDISEYIRWTCTVALSRTFAELFEPKRAKLQASGALCRYIGLNMLLFAASVIYSIALHAVLLQRRYSHSTGDSILQSRAYFPISSCDFFTIR